MCPQNYKIGSQGIGELDFDPLWKGEPHKNPLLVKLFFSSQAGRETLLTQLRLLQNLHQQKVRLYKSQAKNVIQESIARRPKLKKDAFLWEATRRFGEQYEQMCLNWLDETITLVEKNSD